MVAGGPDSERDDYAYPSDVESELRELGYEVHPDVPVTSNKDIDAADALVGLIDKRFESFHYLLENRPVDVGHLTIFYINVLQHFFWRDDITKRGWKVIDKHIGDIRDSFPDSSIYLMSDHGCTEIDTVFHVNSWLEREGYLVTESDMTNIFAGVGLNKTQLSRLAHKLGTHGLVTRLAPQRLVNLIPQDQKGFKRKQKLERVNWEQSSAIASGQGLVYAIDDDITDDLVSDLDSLSRNNRQIASEVWKREEIYGGEYVHKAPNIVFDQRDGVHTSGAIGDNPVFTDAGRWKAENVRTGLFLAAGIGTDGNRLKQDMSITDVAPTLLHHLGAPVPTDMDGEPRLVGSRSIEFRDPIPFGLLESGGDYIVAERLEDLGYLE
jgi:predicted AlkP superfamily phosphohydrolase/phosphomutase